MIVIALTQSASLLEDDENASTKILFVNEVCRHGARAPDLEGFDYSGFPNGEGMLTSSGIRQHYLLGLQLNQRYVKKSDRDSSKLLSHQYDVDEIYIRSTQVLRTIQSAETQMLGLYGLGTANKLNRDMKDNAHPHIKISDDSKIIKKLGDNAIEDGYRPVPVHNYDLYVDDLVAYGN